MNIRICIACVSVLSKIEFFVVISRGHADAEIEAVFARYDLDGDRILDEDEQRRMQEDLEGQKVDMSFRFFYIHINIIDQCPKSSIMKNHLSVFSKHHNRLSF